MVAWQPLSALFPFDPEHGAETLAVLDQWASDQVGAKQSAFSSEVTRRLIATITGCSPFLAGLIGRDPEFAGRLFSEDGGELLNEILDELARRAPELNDTPALASLLRQTKEKIALLTAVMDLAGLWSLDMVTGSLSRFADLALDLGVARLLHDRMKRGELAWPRGEEEPASPRLNAGSGFAVLALGKLGGEELNYSSDIDLIVVFDERSKLYQGRRSLADCFIKLTQDLVSLLQKRTKDGYVFRVDLRLRPDPGATPLAISIAAAETYYQSIGQTWERSAMIKARPAAGDRQVAEIFLDRLRPFIWRRSLDFAAIEDIHDIKNRVNRHHRHGDITVAGHDVKLGRGGIREIEFSAQIHQLIAGGREPALQTRNTLVTLAEIEKLGRLRPEERQVLNEAYVFLRNVEHRLQMIADEQTHRMPEDQDGIRRIACLMGYDQPQPFEDALLVHLQGVHRIYQSLLGGFNADDKAGLPNKALPGHLAGLGFAAEGSGPEIISHWRRGRYRALKTERARRLLEACLPDLLIAMSGSSDPDRALARFDTFLEKLPAGVQIFSLFQANHWLFQVIARIMGNAPALADDLARRPQLLDAVLDPGFFDPLPGADTLRNSLQQLLGPKHDYQDMLDMTRRWLGDHRFQVGVHVLEGIVNVDEAGSALSDIADVLIGELIPEVETEFAIRHGLFPGGELAVIAMGSYGGNDLSATSDLDLVFLYDADFNAPSSNGEKPLGPSPYFSRLGQHVITAMTIHTAEGALFKLDLRLRPSGRDGPLIVTVKTFEEYLRTAAWTWEHMALTRARIIHASPAFGARIEATILETVTRPRDADRLRQEVDEMRAKLDSEFGTDNPWSVKYVHGGLVDVEFLVQFLILREGHVHSGLFDPSLVRAINNLAAIDALSSSDARKLTAAHQLMLGVRGFLRLCHGSNRSEKDFSNGLKKLLADATQAEDFDQLKSRLEEAERFVYALYKSFLR